VSVYNHNK